MSLLNQVRTGFIFLFSKPNSRPSSSVNPVIGYVYKPFKRYSKESRKQSSSHDVEERAPSTAEEFKRVAEEKLRAAKQGVASQTSEKLYDGAEEATIGDSKVDSIKNSIKEHEQ
ncbi:hypothetical protein LWI29_028982 [Acer saccharum]|uniref:Uncharacterized protein n=1 Tax=Acer saccharum TaxID=4024 RepID=A0AA39SNK3_ACESA|nr:hypothetical protein LWI29_028982 [Acer saccharum]